jgi:LysM repeat protein
MDENNSTASQSSLNAKALIGIFWIISLLFTGYLCYAYGKESVQSQPKAEEKVLQVQTKQIEDIQAPTASPDTTTTLQSFEVPAEDASVNTATTTTAGTTCSKTGLAQKWEYLKPYVVKANDSLESVATEQLKDASRVNELLKINGVGPFVVGSTLYLPPDTITKSSGNIQLVYGKLVERNDTSWHISFTSDKSGQGVLIPSYLFTSVSNKDAFKIGDCIGVLFDNGYKIYSITPQ